MDEFDDIKKSRKFNISVWMISTIVIFLLLVISVFTLLIFMYLPFFQKYLHMSPIDWIDWIMVIISMLAVFYWEEIRKVESKN